MKQVNSSDCTIISTRSQTLSAIPCGNVTSIYTSNILSPNMITANQPAANEPNSTNQEPLCNNPAKEAALQALCKATGYIIKQENGQRKYGGPPPNWNDAIPGKGCEIFVGKLPRDLYEDELVPVLERCGRIYELRLMMDFNGNNRGFAFVKYCAQNDARRALKELNNFEIRKGRLLGVCKSVDNCRLFVGGIPKTKQKEEILEEMQKITEGVVNAIVYPSAADKNKNRGFAFVEYQDHHTAAMARRKLMHTRPQVWGHPIAVDWAEPEVEVDDDVMATVKILYVRNLMLNTTEEQLEKEFTAVVPPEAIERVKKIRDYGFVHFNSRENALKCMKALNGKPLDGAPMEVTLAKPVDRETYVRYTRAANRTSNEAPETLAASYPGFITTTYDPATAYPYAGTPIYYGGVPYAAAAIPALSAAPRYSISSALRNDFPQLQPVGIPQIGAAGVPLGIPGATTGITAAQGRGVSGRGRTRGVSRGIGARNVLNLGRGFPTTYYSHYNKGPRWQVHPQVVSGQLQGQVEKYDLLPGMELTPINPLSLKPSNHQKSSIQLLEEYCTKMGLQKPEYKLHSADGQSGRPLFLYRVEIPSSDNKLQSEAASQQSQQQEQEPCNQQSLNPTQYTPTKLCTSLEVAKEVAASHVLNVLHVDNNNNTNNAKSTEIDTAYGTDGIIGSVGNMSIRSPDLNGYVYGNSIDDPYPSFHIYSGVGYTAANEAYTTY